MSTDPREVIREALAGGEVEWESDRRAADDGPDEWCAECIPRPAAAINAARIAVAALSAAGWTLLPPGGETREQWNIRDASGRVNPDLIPCYGRRLVEGLLPDRPGGRLVRREIRTWPDGSVWTGPWTKARVGEPHG